MKRVLVVLLSVFIITAVFGVENADKTESKWYSKGVFGYHYGNEVYDAGSLSFYNLEGKGFVSISGFNMNPGIGFAPFTWNGKGHAEKLVFEIDVPFVYGKYTSKDDESFNVSGEAIRFAPTFTVNCLIAFPDANSSFLQKLGINFGVGLSITGFMLHGAEGVVKNTSSAYCGMTFNRENFSTDLQMVLHFVINAGLQFDFTEKFSALIEFKKYLLSRDSDAAPGFSIGAGIKRKF